MNGINFKTTTKALVLFSAIFLVTILHYKTNREEMILHVIHRELYFIPIVLGGFWFGLRGGLTISLVVSALYLPVAIVKSNSFTSQDFSCLLEILLFIIIGILVGWLKNRETNYQNIRRKEEGLAVMGQAVACVAHDMKTPLIAIGGLVRQIRRKIPDEDRASSKLDMVLQQTERLELMLKDMLAFAKPLELNCEYGYLNKLIQETILIAEEKSMKHNVQLSLRLQGDLSIYWFDYHRLQQALLNLINNAVEASQADGKVFIRSKLDVNNIFIEVEDSGEGIASENFDEILRPFFSSKKEGTGLGLPIVKKIVEAHGGSLQYEQQGERGLVFRMIFPALKEL